MRQLAELSEDSARVRGADDYETLRVRQEHARWADRLSGWSRAVDLLNDLLADRERARQVGQRLSTKD